MYGAILGDIIGSPYEFDMGDKTKDFPLFCEEAHFTDDSVMTVAIGEALMLAKSWGLLDQIDEDAEQPNDGKLIDEFVYSNRKTTGDFEMPKKLDLTIEVILELDMGEEETEPDATEPVEPKLSTEQTVKNAIIDSMKTWGAKYPNAGYGWRFYHWLFSDDSEPYGSYGNGSAMRVAAAGWMLDNLEDTRKVARWTAEVTHNHPEGVKGAEATAAAIYMARTGSTKEEIKEYIIREFGYDLSRTCDEIRPDYHHVESCQETVPEAITAFLEGEDFEDVIRTAVSLGGDCDTLTCIAGSMAEAFYGVPEELIAECEDRLPEDMLEVVRKFKSMV